jgi:hypothetical protein
MFLTVQGTVSPTTVFVPQDVTFDESKFVAFFPVPQTGAIPTIFPRTSPAELFTVCTLTYVKSIQTSFIEVTGTLKFIVEFSFAIRVYTAEPAEPVAISVLVL